jgi:hypothetical protein
MWYNYYRRNPLTLGISLISQKLFCMFRVMKVHVRKSVVERKQYGITLRTAVNRQSMLYTEWGTYTVTIIKYKVFGFYNIQDGLKVTEA